MEWISVKDRVPTDDTMTIVTVENGNGERYIDAAWYNSDANQLETFDGGYDDDPSYPGIVAWIPTPKEPYAGE